MGIFPPSNGLCVECQKEPYWDLAGHWKCAACAAPYFRTSADSWQRSYFEASDRARKAEARIEARNVTFEAPLIAAIDEVINGEVDPCSDTNIRVSAEAMQKLMAAVENYHERLNAPGILPDEPTGEKPEPYWKRLPLALQASVLETHYLHAFECLTEAAADRDMWKKGCDEWATIAHKARERIAELEASLNVLSGIPIEKHDPSRGLCPHGHWKNGACIETRGPCPWCLQIRDLLQVERAQCSHGAPVPGDNELVCVGCLQPWRLTGAPARDKITRIITEWADEFSSVCRVNDIGPTSMHDLASRILAAQRTPKTDG
jgi:hypothetical protein